jgi:hypothetical protein
MLAGLATLGRRSTPGVVMLVENSFTTRHRAAGMIAALLLVASATAHAADWLSVAKTDRTEAFVNPASLGRSGAFVVLRTRQNFTEAQPAAKKGKSFLSARSEYRVDCAARKLAYREIHAYEALDLQGAEVQKTRIGEKNLKWMDAPATTVFGAILDYACEHGPAEATLPAPQR